MTITCSRSKLSDTGRQAGVVDSYLETQCTEQFAARSQTNWIWATLDWGPTFVGCLDPPTAWLPGRLAGWLRRSTHGCVADLLARYHRSLWPWTGDVVCVWREVVIKCVVKLGYNCGIIGYLHLAFL